MSETTHVEPVQCKGRNGYFDFHHVDVWELTGDVYVQFYSKRSGDAAPIQFGGTRDQLLSLFTGIVERLEALEAGESSL